MKTIIQKCIITMACLSSFYAEANVMVQRCAEVTHNFKLKQTFNAAQSKNIIRWASRCEERFIDELTGNSYIKDLATGEKRILFPVFGKKEYVSDPDSLTGKKAIYTNPRNYHPNITAIDHNHATAPCDIPGDYKIVAFCGAGCFTPDQEVWFELGDTPIGDAKEYRLSSVMAVSPNSTTGDIIFKPTDILGGRYIQTDKPQKEEILTIHTADKSISITPNHPMLKPDGHMVQAMNLKVGDFLVNVDGKPEAITSIDEKEFFGHVLNIETDAQTREEHIISAQGILTGDFFIQTLDLSNANRFLMRQTLFPIQHL